MHESNPTSLTTEPSRHEALGIDPSGFTWKFGIFKSCGGYGAVLFGLCLAFFCCAFSCAGRTSSEDRDASANGDLDGGSDGAGLEAGREDAHLTDTGTGTDGAAIDGGADVDAEVPTGPEPILTLVDDNVESEYPTYFTSNQRVVKNSYGIFLTYLKTHFDGGSGGTSINEWMLKRSVDGGDTFETAFRNYYTGSQQVLGKAPEIVTDDHGNIYLATVMGDQKVYVYKFAPPDFNAWSYVQMIPYGGFAPKFSFYYDRVRDRLVVMTAAYMLFIDKDTGQVIGDNNFQILKEGTIAYPQYSFLAMAPNGDMFAAWHNAHLTTQHYYSIHFAISYFGDAGITWRNYAGNAIGSKGNPIVCDSTGPADMVNLPQHLSNDGTRTNGLNSFFYKNFAFHFFHGGAVPGDWNLPRYTKYQWSPSSIVHRITGPDLGGENITLDSSDGFFCSADDLDAHPLFLVSHTGGRIVALKSHDNGTTWEDHAESSFVATSGNIYSVAGSRRVVDGFIYGVFSKRNPSPPHKVYFFRIPES